MIASADKQKERLLGRFFFNDQAFLFSRHHVNYLGQALGAGEVGDFAGRELNNALGHGVEGIIGAAPDVLAGQEFGAALTNNNAAGFGRLPRKEFNAQIFWLRVSAEFC